MSRRSLLPLVVALLASFVAAGCHEDRPDRAAREDAGTAVGGPNMEQDIADGVLEQLELEVGVTCPEDIEPEEGGSFECEAQVGEDEDAVFPVDVEQTDADGNIEWTARALPTPGVEESIAVEIREQRSVEVEVECPEAVELEVGFEFGCTATEEDGEETPVRATVKDEDGSVSWET
jgi:Domain of unknown function (DUF4333)